MAHIAPLSRVAVIGTGLVGGSFALALRGQFPQVSLVGFDLPEQAARAASRGVVSETAPDLSSAVGGADLVYVALPIIPAIEMLPVIAAAAEPHALVTDACSTKAAIGLVARQNFKAGALFLGGHPMAGKEHSGIDNADAGLFRGAPYALIASGTDGEDRHDPRVKNFAALLEAIGAQPVWCDATTHDWAVGIVSHLPQLVSLALARVVQDETDDETGFPLRLAGPGLQDMLRIAGSPYGVWRDILLTNTQNISRALDRLAQAVDYLRTRLATRELEQEFEVANELHRNLRKQP
jgi:prephenate dehydrogenase